MSATVVNLRLARKARARAAAETVAARNRATFGQSKVEREHAAVDRARIARTLDGAKTER